jgi:glucose/arabinose dehydrogenase
MSRTRLAVHNLEDRLTPVVLPPNYQLTTIATGLTQPSALVETPDGRLLVTEQQGTLRVVTTGSDLRTPGTLLPTPALQLTVNFEGERGLIGIALDPNFSTNNFVYLYYTVPASSTTTLHNRVSRFTMSGNTIDPSTERILLDLDPLGPTNHNGGGMVFGNDGKLYLAVGENSTPNNSQILTTYHGKILRLNSDGTIPADNPTTFAGITGTTSGPYRAIYATGFRNPFTIGIDPRNGQIYANDVGQAAFEEVNRLSPGANFGWPATEGDFTQSSFPNFTRPVVNYPHVRGTDGGFSVIGGGFATGTRSLPGVGDEYLYGDFVNGWIRTYNPATQAVTLFASELDNVRIVDLDASTKTGVLVVNRGITGANAQGAILAITPVAPPVVPPPPLTGAIGNGNSPQVRVLEGSQLGSPLNPPLRGETRVATGYRQGGFSPILVVGTGPGETPRVAVVDTRLRELISSATVFESTFTGGVFVASADFDGNGIDEVIVSPDQGGGPRVRVFRDGNFNDVMADFFGIDDPNFRGGARVAAGDVDGDGRADLLVAAGFLGGPRVAGYSGVALASGRTTKIFNDFFAFEQTLRNGVFLAAGDIDFDGRHEVIVGGGPGGGPRVQIFSGANLVQNNSLTSLANFFAGDPNGRNGVRVGVVKTPFDGADDLLVGFGPGGPSRVFQYTAANLLASSTPTATGFTPFGEEFTGGVFVG